MKVQVDSSKCQGHNRCMIFAPEVFEVDDYGFASAQGGGEVPAELADKARTAAANCPELAIVISEG
ncbi:MAG: ferredoxin [Dehalococcoidia bacterium]|jgi:ferredoxin